VADVILKDAVLDGGIDLLNTAASALWVCSATPTDYADAVTKKLGSKTLTAGAVFGNPADATPNGRQVTSVAVTDGVVDAGGTVTCWAAIDVPNTRLLAVGDLSGGMAVTAGWAWTLGAFTIRAPATAASTFTPASLPNLLAWYKADAGTFSDAGSTPTTNGQGTDQWNDQSGNNYHLSGHAVGLTYLTGQLNGLPVLNQTGSKQAVIEFNPVALGGTVLSMFMVFKISSDGATAQRVLSICNGTNDLAADGLTIYQASSTSLKTHNAGDKGACTLSNNVWTQVGSIFDGVNNTMYVNNVAGTPVTATPTFNAAVNFGVTGDTGGSTQMIGQIAELIITKSALNSTERGNLAAYFTTRWGV
jgi:hypothetical protein